MHARRSFAAPAKRVPWLIPLAIALTLATAYAAAPTKRSRPLTPFRTNVFDDQRRIDAGETNLFHTNHGSFGWDLLTGQPGLFYPRGTTNTAMFAAGLWLGARVQGQLRVTVAEYSQEYGPGAIVAGIPDDYAAPRYVSYKVVDYTGNPQDTAHVDRTPAELAADPTLDPLVHHSWSEFIAGAAAYGAPTRTYRLPVTSTPDPFDSVNVVGPAVRGDQMTWCVFNDADPAWHTNDAGSTVPLGVEVQQIFWTYARLGILGSTTFMEYKIIHKGSEVLEDMLVSIWSDPDLGGFTDDLVGCDPGRDLGFCYNATDADLQYGRRAPALGLAWLKGPIGALGDTLPLHSFNRYINGTDPQSPDQTYNYMLGLAADGSPVIDPTTGQVTRFAYPGDPVAGTGWRDSVLTDKRMMISSGTFTMAPGDTQTVVVGLVVAQGTDRLHSITVLREYADFVRTYHRLGAAGLGPADLAVIKQDVPAVLQGCGPFELGFRIVNLGQAAPSTRTVWTLSGPFPVGGMFLYDAQDPGLLPGEALDRTTSLQLAPGDLVGDLQLLLRADRFNDVAEPDEDNNRSALDVPHPVPVMTALAQITSQPSAQARIRFARSPRDSAITPTPITQYEVYRRIEPGGLQPQAAREAASSRVAAPAAAQSTALAGWDYLGAVPAHAESEYSIVTPLLPEVPSPSGYQAFLIRAATATPSVFFDSCADSMPQVDSLPPPVPPNFRVVNISAQGDVQLAWDASASPDLRRYRLHRGGNPAFVPSDLNRIALTTALAYTDPGAAPGALVVYYKVSAEDFVGNRSDYAATPAGTVDVPDGAPPTAFALHAAVPNPAREGHEIRFDLPSACPVTLEVFDVGGRVVRSAFGEALLPAGRHRWTWDARDSRGRPLHSGVFLIRLRAGHHVATDRILLLR